MKLAYLNPPISMKPTEPAETAFLRARQEWDTRMGSTLVQARNWRMAFFGTVVLLALLCAANIALIKQSKVIPIVVGIDREKGEPVVIGRASEVRYTAGPMEIKYFLSNFIRLVRAVPSDSVVIKQNWLRAYKFLRSDAATMLNNLIDSDSESALKEIGKKTVIVQPVSVTQVAESNSYQMRWHETMYSIDGMKLDEYTMVGVFSIEIDTPRDEETLQENPLGLFIANFQWNRELK